MIYKHFFVFNGKPSSDFKVGIRGTGVFDAPRRATDSVYIEGRNGALTINKGYFENINVVYPCYMVENFQQNVTAFRDFLMSNIGYCRLEDNINPDEYRMGRVASSLELDVKGIARAGEFKLTFDCKPQRYLKSGEVPVVFTSSGSIKNPTNQVALPLIRIYGTGTLGVGSTSITVTSVDEYVDIDCEIMDAFKGAVNCNANIVVANHKFPKLEGETGISISGGITRVEITPRWWRL